MSKPRHDGIPTGRPRMHLERREKKVRVSDRVQVLRLLLACVTAALMIH